MQISKAFHTWYQPSLLDRLHH